MIVPRSEWPEWLRAFSVVKGVCVGECAATRGPARWLPREKAHAHMAFRKTGWICFRTEAQLRSKQCGLHEIAHLLQPKEDVPLGIYCHTESWLEKLKEIGGRVGARELEKVENDRFQKANAARHEEWNGRADKMAAALAELANEEGTEYVLIMRPSTCRYVECARVFAMVTGAERDRPRRARKLLLDSIEALRSNPGMTEIRKSLDK